MQQMSSRSSSSSSMALLLLLISVAAFAAFAIVVVVVVIVSMIDNSIMIDHDMTAPRVAGRFQGATRPLNVTTVIGVVVVVGAGVIG